MSNSAPENLSLNRDKKKNTQIALTSLIVGALLVFTCYLLGFYYLCINTSLYVVAASINLYLTDKGYVKNQQMVIKLFGS